MHRNERCISMHRFFSVHRITIARLNNFADFSIRTTGAACARPPPRRV